MLWDRNHGTPIKLYDSGVVKACGGFSHSIVLRTPTEMVYSHTGDFPVDIDTGHWYTFDIILDSPVEGSFGGVMTIETSLVGLELFHIPIWGNVTQ